MISAFRNKFSVFTPLLKRGAFPALNSKSVACFASKEKEVNPKSYESLKENNWLVYDSKHQNSYTTHKSVAEQFIHRIPVVYVDRDIARCMGGTKPRTGHAQVYIQLNTRDPSKPSTCPYCGLKFMKRPHDDHGHGHGPEHH